MSVLTREAILSAEDLDKEEVPVPEWNGGSVFVRCMTGTEKDSFEKEAYPRKGDNVEFNRDNFRARLLVRTIVDAEGKRIFSDGDIEVLGKKSSKALDRLFAVASRVNALEKKEIDNLAKNS